MPNSDVLGQENISINVNNKHSKSLSGPEPAPLVLLYELYRYECVTGGCSQR